MMKILLLILSVLPGILAGDFNAQTLSVEEQDSILAITATGSPSEISFRYRLECENEQKIFRRSHTADWYIYDTLRHTRKKIGEGLSVIGDGLRVRDAVMSPNGKYVAFAIGNNL